jgi:transcriptional repressor NrdR
VKCPVCGSFEDKVVESRSIRSGSAVRRRRECLLCAARFTSYETIEQTALIVVKRNNRRENFDRGKIEKGLLTALKKRPVSRSAFEAVLESVISEVEAAGQLKGEVSSSRIGEIILKKLFTADKVAYVRFASVYRQFSGMDEFIAIIKEAGEN